MVQLTNACCLNHRKKEFAKTVMVWKKLYRQFLVNNTDPRKKEIQKQVNKMLSSAKIKRTHIQNLTKLLIQNKVICGFCVSLLKKTNRDYHEVSTIYNTLSGKTSSGKIIRHREKFLHFSRRKFSAVIFESNLFLTFLLLLIP